MGAEFVQAESSAQALTVENIVRRRTGGSIRQLKVEVTEGAIVLAGHTTTYYAKQLATHAVLEAIGDSELSNNIEVR